MLVRTDTRQPWRGEALNDIRHPLAIETLWTAEQLAAVGLVKAIAMTIPDGFRAAGRAAYAADGTETIPLEPIPPPTAEEIELGRERTLDRELATLAFRVLFEQENRIRGLEGKGPIGPQAFRAALKAMV